MATAPNNKIQYITHLGHKFLAVTSEGNTTTPWMGVNEFGFAIINSSSPDLPGGSSYGASNGSLMQYALSNCKTVDNFQAVFDMTNKTGRTTGANFAVIDTTGAAANFETGHLVYWKYDADDSPDGYILRTNFALNGGETGGIERYIRTKKLLDGNGEGLWTRTFPFEDRILTVTDSLLTIWRDQDELPVDAMIHYQDSMATEL